jgi:ribose-phosphate pyrophosphokinase
MFRYPAGEVQVRLTEEQANQVIKSDEVHIYARIKDGEIMGLAMLNDALKQCNSVIKLFLPYLPYSRADRSFTQNDCFGLHVFATMINMMDFDEVVTLDVHSDVAEVEIDNLRNVSADPIIKSVIDDLKPDMILLPDAGSLKRYHLYDVYTNTCSKKRDPETGKFIGFNVPPKKSFIGVKSVLIVDDICDGGGTFLGIAEALKDYGLELNLYVTHGIFSKGYNDLLMHFNKIYTTNSFHTYTIDSPNFKMMSCIELLGASLERVE